MSEDRKLYAPPSLQALTAYVSAAVVLFFAGFNFSIFSEFEQMKREFAELREENESLKRQLAYVPVQQVPVAYARPAQPMAPQPGAPQQAPEPVAAAATPVDKAPQQPSVTAPESAPAPRTAIAEKKTPSAESQPESMPEQETQKPRRQAAAKIASKPKESLAAGDIALNSAPTGLKKDIAAHPVAAPEIVDTALPDSISHMITEPGASRKKSAESAKATSPATTPASAVSTGPSGQILATNPDQRRVIISVGSANGLESGARFNIYRDGTWVGEVRVAKVFADMSMCDITSPTTRGIRKGDVARMASTQNAAKSN